MNCTMLKQLDAGPRDRCLRENDGLDGIQFE